MTDWHPIATYDALAIKPQYAVFFFPAAHTDGSAFPEEIRAERSHPSRSCTLWYALPDPVPVRQSEPLATDARMTPPKLTSSQTAALRLLAQGKADFHAAIKAGANLATMSALVKAGLASMQQAAGIKQWQITDWGAAVLRTLDPDKR